MPVEVLKVLKGILGKKPEKSQGVPPTEPVHSAGSTEIINLEKHCLRNYPGFFEFADKWNKYVKSPSRATLKEATGPALLKNATLLNESARLKEKAERLRAERDSARVRYEAKTGVREAERIALKRATRDFRRVWEDLDKTLHSEQVEKERQTKARASLTNSDWEFGFTLSEDGTIFYALERLRTDQGAVDQGAVDEFFSEDCARKGLIGYARKLALDSLNFRFLSLRRYYSGEESGSEEAWRLAKKATERQLWRS